MKVICEGLTLCERVIEDKQTGLLTVVGWLERLQAMALPGVHHGFAFATRFCLADDVQLTTPVACEIQLLREDDPGQIETVWKASASWMPETERLRAFQNFGVLRLKKPGRVRFHLEFRLQDEAWQRAASAHVDVAVQEMSAEMVRSMRAELLRLKMPIPEWLVDTEG